MAHTLESLVQHTCRSVFAVAAATFVSAGAARAQSASPECGGQTLITIDACQKAVDLFNFMAPQLGTSITGGNAVIGGAGTLGGLGHFSLGVRANVIRGQLPQTNGVQLSFLGRQSSSFAPKSQVLGLPTAEAAIGIFKGVPLGLTNVGGIDALVSAFYVPDIDQDEISVRTSGGKVKLGYGVRVGILQESALVPGVSVSYLRRDLPKSHINALIGNADSVSVRNLDAKTSAWRLAASKGFTIIGLTAGIGQDRYDAEATAHAYIAPRTVGPIAVSFSGDVASVRQKLTRTNVFGGLSLNLTVLRIAAEVGQVTGGSITAPYNTFGGKSADDSYTYGSLGLRIGF